MAYMGREPSSGGTLRWRVLEGCVLHQTELADLVQRNSSPSLGLYTICKLAVVVGECSNHGEGSPRISEVAKHHSKGVSVVSEQPHDHAEQRDQQEAGTRETASQQQQKASDIGEHHEEAEEAGHQ